MDIQFEWGDRDQAIVGSVRSGCYSGLMVMEAIQIAKSLRIREDCHLAIKTITLFFAEKLLLEIKIIVVASLKTDSFA